MAEDGNGKPYRGTRPFEVCLATPCLLHSRPASLTNPTVSVCLLSSCLYMDHVCCIRMWQALVPGKPWTAKYLTVDDVMAKQSRRGPNAQRYKDGAFRPNRPFPEGYSPRSQNAALSLSPRFRDRAGGVYEWAGTMPDYKTTTSNHYCEPHGHEYIVPTRHGLSPRNPVSSVSQSIFGDGYLQFSPRSKVNAGIKLPPLGSINAIGKPPPEPATSRGGRRAGPLLRGRRGLRAGGGITPVRSYGRKPRDDELTVVQFRLCLGQSALWHSVLQ